MKLPLSWTRWIKQKRFAPDQQKSVDQLLDEVRDLDNKLQAKLAELQATVADMNRKRPLPLFPGHRDDEEGR